MGLKQCDEAAGHGWVRGEVGANEAAVELHEVRPRGTCVEVCEEGMVTGRDGLGLGRKLR
jgi:hypothetical protein